jgi:hypothetical protein
MSLHQLSPSEVITVVSGLPRSGTSMMMRMLDAGGLPVLTDSRRLPDESNPNGYYEFERVKKLGDGDCEWLEAAQGKAVKVVSGLLEFLPPIYPYKVLFMQRHILEIVNSQREMLMRLQQDADSVRDEQYISLFQKHTSKVEAWISHQPMMELCHVNYNDLMVNPWIQLEKIQEFLGIPLNLQNMLQVVDRKLYRHRSNS